MGDVVLQNETPRPWCLHSTILEWWPDWPFESLNMFKSQSLCVASVVAFLPVTFAAAILSYILMGTNGNIWASTPLEMGVFLAIGLNFVGYVLALAHRSAGFLIANVVLSFLMVLLFVAAVVGSFPGTGGRYGNHGLSAMPYIGLACAILVLPQNARWARSHVLAALLAVLVVPLATYFTLSAPLYEAIRDFDLSSTCLIQTSPDDYDFRNAKRIRSVDDLELGILIGEHSPRVVNIEKMRTRSWLYSGRKFGQPRSLAQLPLICASDTL